MATVEDSERGARAAMALHEAAMEAGRCLTDGEVARRDIQGIRANARWLVQGCEKALGEPHPGDVKPDSKLRQQVRIARDRCVDLSISSGLPAERFAQQAVAQARLDMAVEMAELIMERATFTKMMDELGLTPHYPR